MSGEERSGEIFCHCGCGNRMSMPMCVYKSEPVGYRPVTRFYIASRWAVSGMMGRMTGKSGYREMFVGKQNRYSWTEILVVGCSSYRIRMVGESHRDDNETILTKLFCFPRVGRFQKHIAELVCVLVCTKAKLSMWVDSQSKHIGGRWSTMIN